MRQCEWGLATNARMVWIVKQRPPVFIIRKVIHVSTRMLHIPKETLHIPQKTLHPGEDAPYPNLKRLCESGCD